MVLNDEDGTPTGADVLFQQHSIAEIVEICEKILQDISKKNQDLREMVGERYRELIDAADTIQNMKQLACELLSKLRQLPSRCEQFKPRPLNVSNRDPKVFADFAQTKLILDICARLVPLIEAREMISSAALVSLAQLAVRGHQLPGKLLSCHKSLRTSTRLLSKACLMAMADPECNPDSLSEALCALAILEGHCPEKLVRVFFQQRMNHLHEVLDSQATQTKDKFRSVARYLILSLNLAQSLAGDPPYFVGYFEGHRTNSHGIVSLVEDPLSLATQFLPLQLSEFRCVLPESLQNAALLAGPATVQAETFLEQMRLCCREKLALELQCHTECRSIAKAYEHLRASIDETPMHIDLLGEKTPDIYKTFFQEAIVARIAGIFEDTLHTATEQLLTSIHSSFQEAARIKSSNVPSLCKAFDASVKSAINQVSEFVPFRETASIEYRSLSELTSASAEQMLTRIRAFISQCVESGVRCRYFLSILSQLAFALTTCSHLQRVFGSTGWPQRRDLLLESRNLASLAALKVLIEEGLEAFKQSFNIPVTHVLLRLASVKVGVKLSDEGEEGLSVSTIIYLPQHVLLPLNQLLFFTCTRIRAVMDCAVSKRVILQANQLLLEAVEQVYQELIDRCSGVPASVQQELALQLLFDIKYLEKLLSTRASDDIVNQLTSLIDPVDLHMFRPHIDEGVVGLVAQTAMLFGLICPQGAMGKPRKQTSQEHNVMALAEQTTQLFSLLPVSMPQQTRR
ncbi:conserved oligomeric Golgi complex subunit 1-like [Tropilaelaps mercedesae]|uniref:Conserved oligomeric Golgi complex subunit 1 n=1 Tax=Tropilaelaps mercedesae TaxID=418985 RepID=A0A1V9XRN8_9ACAR|nr:conserved oligomeric Golgi complex subunit 1-like [Tropilaelaps mercedesae]